MVTSKSLSKFRSMGLTCRIRTCNFLIKKGEGMTRASRVPITNSVPTSKKVPSLVVPVTKVLSVAR